jgi:BirA family biotin operon repressor/biotin-[acetyl-CoA-carboxylase] ligase
VTPGEPEVHAWAERLERELHAAKPPALFDRVIALEETASTQDAALALCQARPGLIVLASRQTAGRGRLGRQWHHHADRGLAMTFVLSAGAFLASRLSIAAGLACAAALDSFSGDAAPLGVRWPNDVVEAHPSPGGGRKLAGILVEVRESVSLLGIGINVNQLENDDPPELHGRIVSLRRLAGGEPIDRAEVAAALVRNVQRALSMELPELIQRWLARDVLTGSMQTFIHDGREIRGQVESLEPTGEIVVRTIATGERSRLPALTTSLKKG